MRVSMKDFAAFGDFGPVIAGFKPASLEAVFGNPEATGGTSRRQRSPLIWKYGDFEFHFARPDGQLCLIHLDRFSATDGCPRGWGQLAIDPWVIREGLARDPFIAAIDESGLRYTIRLESQYNQEVVVLASGVEIGFICRPDTCSGPVGLAWLSLRVAAAKPVATVTPAKGFATREIKVAITRYVSDDPQPGIVECELVDVRGRRWQFIEKTAVVSSDYLDANSGYPQPGVIAGEVVSRHLDATGREVIRFNTGRPWGMKSLDGVTQFDVLPEALVELEPNATEPNDARDRRRT